MNWYALFVESGKETLVQKAIRNSFNESLCYSIVPKRKLIERKQGIEYQIDKILFPGYVFVHTTMCEEIYYKIKKIPRTLRILNNDNSSYWSNISDKEMAPIIELIDDNGIIDSSSIFLEDSNIIVKDGPLKGLEGIIKKIDKHRNRAKIELTIMNEPRLIDVGIEILNKK